MAALTAVYDTNVLISAFIGKGTPYKILKATYKGNIDLVLSPEILIEFEGVLKRSKFHFKEKHIRSILSVVVKVARIVSPDVVVDIVKDDPADNRIIEAAISGKANYIVTGDSHLLSLERIKRIKIVTPKEFLDLLVE